MVSVYEESNAESVRRSERVFSQKNSDFLPNMIYSEFIETLQLSDRYNIEFPRSTAIFGTTSAGAMLSSHVEQNRDMEGD